MDILTPRERIFVGSVSILTIVLGLVVLFNARLDPARGGSDALNPVWLEAHAHLAAPSSAPSVPAPRSYFGGNSAARLARRTAADTGPSGAVSPGPSPVPVTGRQRSTPENWKPSAIFAPARFPPSPNPAASPMPDR